MTQLSIDQRLHQATCLVKNEQTNKIATAWLIDLAGGQPPFHTPSTASYLLTVAHVLGHEQPVSQVKIRFSDDVWRTATLVTKGYDPDSGLDFAILEVDLFSPPPQPSPSKGEGVLPSPSEGEGPGGRQPLPLSLSQQLEPHSKFSLRGYGITFADQSIGHGVVVGDYHLNKKENLLFMLNSEQLAIDGYSGGAVFSHDLNAVVAIQIRTTTEMVGVGANEILALPLYRIVTHWPRLTELAEKWATLLPTQPGLRLELPERVDYFTNRKVDLANLKNDLRPGHTVTICGPGGMGKSSLAAEVLWDLTQQGKRHPAMFPDGVIMHDFYRQRHADEALEHIARSFGVECKNPQESAKLALSGRTPLLLLDGTEDADDLAKVYSVTGNCGVLVTTRKGKDAKEDRRYIEPLPLDDAVELLEKIVHSPIQNPKSKIQNQEICQILGGWPLAISLAGHCLRNGEPPAAYLAWLRESPFEALEKDEASHRRESVAILLDKSMLQISEPARQALSVIGLLALAPFSREHIARALGGSANSWRKPLENLANYGLLRRESTGEYRLAHALIRDYVRAKYPAPPEVAIRLVEYYTPWAKEQSQREAVGFKELDQEREHILALLSQESTLTSQSRWDLVWAIRNYMFFQGHVVAFRVVISTTLTVAHQAADKATQANCIQALGDVHLRVAEYDRARQRYEEARPIYADIGARLGEANCIQFMGKVAIAEKKWAEAENLLKAGLQICVEINNIYGAAWALYDLGQIAEGQGEPTEAAGYYRQALSIMERLGLARDTEGFRKALGRVS